MQKNILSIILGVTVVYYSGCKSSKNAVSMNQPVNWQKNIITVDGNDNEWEKPLRYRDLEEKLSYSISYDNNNVYICFKTNNNILQFKILHSGLIVYLNKYGQKRETAGIYFPIGRKPGIKEQGIFSPVGGGKPPLLSSDLSVKKEMLSKQNEYLLFGFAKSDGQYGYEKQNEDDIVVRVGFNELQELVYEASVPLRAIFHHMPSLNYSASRNLAIGFFVRGFPGTGFSGSSFPPILTGGPGSGPPGMGGTGGREEAQDIQKLFQDTKVWKVIPLASLQSKK